MKTLFVFMFVLVTMTVAAQDLLISFAGTGASSSITTIKVDNLTSGTSTTLNGDDILRLTGTTGIGGTGTSDHGDIRIYPNPMQESSRVEFVTPFPGDAVITISDLAGRQLFLRDCFLESCSYEFLVGGLPVGIYLVDIRSVNYRLSGRLVSSGGNVGSLSVGKPSALSQISKSIFSVPDSKGEKATIDMVYNQGDLLLFTATSGNYTTLITDIPAQDKTITFSFASCTDGDNKNYPVVKIGTQVWMAENLRTTKYRDGVTSIPLVEDNNTWMYLTTPAYCWFMNNESTYGVHGVLYNWYVVNTGNLCPSGWHVPSDAEWTTLQDYLIATGYNYDGTTSGNKIAKAMSATTRWSPSSVAGSPGNTDYPGKRNASGFSAFASGYRISTGTFSAIGTHSYWWSSTPEGSSYAYHRLIQYNTVDITRFNYNRKMGMYVRCIKD